MHAACELMILCGLERAAGTPTNNLQRYNGATGGCDIPADAILESQSKHDLQESVTEICSAVASNRPTEVLASVISFTFVVYSHYKHSYT